MNDRVSTRWLFKLMDYEHWAVDVDNRPFAMIIVNPADRTVNIQVYDDADPNYTLRNVGNWRAWLRWLNEHEAASA